MFSCEIYEIFKNTYFEEQLRTTTSVSCWTKEMKIIITYAYLLKIYSNGKFSYFSDKTSRKYKVYFQRGFDKEVKTYFKTF